MNLSLSLTNNMSLTGAAAVEFPLSLSPAAWYDPSDTSTLWKDTAGTDPVTTDGDAVARIDDKSGNDNHLIQATAANRPLYKTSGGLHWLLFDGTDGLVSSAAATLTDGSGQWSSYAAAHSTSDASDQYLLVSDDGAAANLARFININFNVARAVTWNTGETAFADNGGVVVLNSDMVVSAVCSTTAIESKIDGVSGFGGFFAGSTAVTGTLKSQTGKVCMGHADGGSQDFSGRVHGAIIVPDALGASDQSALLTYMAALQGRVL
jgi:hypothetical protein